MTDCWQIHPQAVVVRLSHSSIHPFLISLLTEDTTRALLRSLLLVTVVNRHHLPASFYSHGKDTFCHLWLLLGTARELANIRWRWGRTGKWKRPRNSILPCSYFYLMQHWQYYKLEPKCGWTVPSVLSCMTDINPHLSVWSNSGLSQPVSCADTIVSPIQPWKEKCEGKTKCACEKVCGCEQKTERWCHILDRSASFIMQRRHF